MRSKRIFSIAWRTCVYVFAAAGFVLVVGYLAVRFHLTDVAGRIDLNDRYLAGQGRGASSGGSGAGQAADFSGLGLGCKFTALERYSKGDAARVAGAYQNGGSAALALRMIGALALRASGTPLGNALSACDAEWGDTAALAGSATGTGESVYPWMSAPEWATLSSAVQKDASMVRKVSGETGVPPRMIVAQLIGEQLRLYNSERELYKQVFAPLNILGSETQFSLGVTGIKADTAIAVEDHLGDPSSPYYPGASYAHLLDFTTADHTGERYDRITDEHNHYYSYLYTALFIKEVETQWAAAGYPIGDRPDIVSTLYNLGFSASHPNADPHVGGSVIQIGGVPYTFGSLGYEFYYSGALEQDFPYTEGKADAAG